MARLQQGTSVRPKAEGYGAQIASRWYRLAASPEFPVMVQSADSLAKRLDQIGSVHENVLDVGYAFSRNNLTGGEGLDWYPRVSQTGEPQPNDEIRFWDSKNLSILHPDAGQQYRMQLARLQETFYTPATLPVDLAVSGEYIYVGWGTMVEWFDDWTDNTPAGAFDFGVDVSLVVASSGNDVYVLTTDGHLWFKAWNSSVFTDVYDLTGPGHNDRPLTNIWLVKGRLLAERVDIVSTAGTVELVSGTPVGEEDPGDPQIVTWTLNFILIDTAQGRFRRCIDAGTAVVGIVSDGSVRSYVPQTDTSGADTTLTIRGRTNVPTGEEPLSIGYGAGKLVVLTVADQQSAASQGVRAYTAEVLSEQFDFIVGNMQIRRVWNGTNEPPSKTKNMPSSRDRIIWMVEELTGGETAWAYDVTTDGLHRIIEIGDDSTALIIFDSVAGYIQGPNVVRQSTTHFQPSGYLITPNINFGLNTDISWMSVVLEGQDLETAGDQIELWRSTDPEAIQDPDHASWVLAAKVSNSAQSGLEVSMIGVKAKSLALQVKVYATQGGTRTPKVTRFAVRGFPAHRDLIVTMPVNVSDMISAPGRMPYRLAGWGNQTHERLLGLIGNSLEVVVLDPPVWVWGVLDKVSEPTEYISDRGSVSVVCQVQVRGKIRTSAGSGIGNAGLGIGKLGVSVLGIGTVLETLNTGFVLNYVASNPLVHDTSVDPTTGLVNWNNADVSLVTQLAASGLDANGLTVPTLWSTASVGDVVQILDIDQSPLNGSNHFTVTVAGAPVDMGGWWQVPVTFVASTGTIVAGAALFTSIRYS